jgi:hypothetical protein
MRKELDEYTKKFLDPIRSKKHWILTLHSYFVRQSGQNTTNGGISKFEVALLVGYCWGDWSPRFDRMVEMMYKMTSDVCLDEKEEDGLSGNEEVNLGEYAAIEIGAVSSTPRERSSWDKYYQYTQKIPVAPFFSTALVLDHLLLEPLPNPNFPPTVASTISAMSGFFNFDYIQINQNFWICRATSTCAKFCHLGFGKRKKESKGSAVRFKNTPEEPTQQVLDKTRTTLKFLVDKWTSPMITEKVCAYALCVSGNFSYDHRKRKVVIPPSASTVALEPEKHMRYIMAFVNGIN